MMMVANNNTLIILFLLLATSLITSIKAKNETSSPPHLLLRLEGNGSYYLLLREQGNILRPIPNIKTALVFDDLSSALQVNERNLSDPLYRMGTSVPSLEIPSYHASADDRVRFEMEKILVLSPPLYWIKSYVIPTMRNPTLVFWRNKSLVLWPDKNYGQHICFIKFGWLNEQNFTLNEKEINYGIGKGTKIATVSFNRINEDPRALKLSDGSILVTTSVKENNLKDHARESFFTMRLNASSGLLELSESALLHSPQIDAVGKNWTPFQFEWSNASYSNYNNSSEVATSEDGDFSTHNSHNTSKNSGNYIYRNHSIDGGDSILFIVNINPLHVVELTPEFEFINGSRRAVLRNIVKNSKKDTSLPWTGKEFGTVLKGGTPALLVRGVYLTIFHTTRLFMLKTVGRRSTYFMGAITFCPYIPFKVHKMSRYPLIDKGWDLYQGPWCFNSLDYVVYPVGLNLDPDGKHLWLSLGHQDAKGDGWFAKLDIDKLFDSMTNVSQC